MKTTTSNNIDEYIGGFSGEVRSRLDKMRATIRKAAPDAVETINYGMPTFKLNGRNLVHFAAFKNHIGFYPAPSGIDEFKEALSRYKGAKGSIQFQHEEPLPFDLVIRIVKYRVKEEKAHVAAKSSKSASSARSKNLGKTKV